MCGQADVRGKSRHSLQHCLAHFGRCNLLSNIGGLHRDSAAAQFIGQLFPALAKRSPMAVVCDARPHAGSDITGTIPTMLAGPTGRKLATAQIPPTERLPDAIGGPVLRAAALKGDPSAAYEIGLRYAGFDRPVIHIMVLPDGSTNQPVPKVQRENKGSPVDELFRLAMERAVCARRCCYSRSDGSAGKSRQH